MARHMPENIFQARGRHLGLVSSRTRQGGIRNANMGLVDYSDSDSEDEAREDTPAPAKKRKTLGDKKDDAPALPPLPASFRNLYSSTVRTSTQDDPSLHAGRKRVIPHVAGNWPTHVYLECKNGIVRYHF